MSPDTQHQSEADLARWPHDAEIEQAVLGIGMARPDLLPMLGRITDEDFFFESYGHVWRIIEGMRGAGRSVSAFSVISALRSIRDAAGLPDAGMESDLNEMAIMAAHRPGDAEALGDVMRYLAQRRRLIAIMDASINDAVDAPVDDTPADMVARTVEALQGVTRSGSAPKGQTMLEVAQAVLDRAFNPSTAERDAVYVGVKEIDDRTGGFMPGEFIVAAGRPGMGKSLFATRMIRTACERGVAVLAFELEMTAAETGARIMCDLARDAGASVWYSSIRKSKVLAGNKGHLADAAAAFADWPLVIDDRPGLKISEIRARARQAKAEAERQGMRLGLIVVDHIGLVATDQDRRGNKVAEMTDISNAMKGMAKEIGCVVLGVSQLNRGVEGREDKRPVLSDLRESGAIEQDADAVLLMYREAYYLKQKAAVMAPADYRAAMDACEHDLEVHCAKLRGGDSGHDVVDIDVATGSIRDRGALL
jgi:replicative DNA helicase